MLSFEQWYDKYLPVINNIDDSASFQDENGNGIMFETFGEEYDKVVKVAGSEPKRVWTYVEGDYGTYIVAGWHYVNRLGYFITEVEWKDESTQVLVSENDDAHID